ncbi:MAG: carboxylesterase family protein [Acidobacteriota bacterium]|nr:carboxylesterase family protein [Acidobacteriota bacterium]
MAARLRTLATTLALSTTLGIFSSAALAADRANTESGIIQGSTQDGVTAYKGIPYAAPPVGNLRWRAPRPYPHWAGVRKTTEYGHDCMQLPFPGDAAPLGTPPAEDCLVLNVWEPAVRDAHADPLPVIVWIHGGGYVNGGSSPEVYDGSAFARHGIIFVSFNYRLGRFGFFAHPALTAEAGKGPTGNFAFMDQIAALKWVQHNIKSFGGDPQRVTLFGESAGGGSVLTMMTSPLARGLFQRAIIESGGGRAGLNSMTLLSKDQPNKPSAETLGVNFAKANGIDATGPAALAALRKIPADKVVNGLNMASMFQAASTYPGPMIDGKLILETPQEAFLAGRAMKIPTIIGANSMDIGFSFARTMDDLFAPFGAHKDAAMAVYDPQHTGNVRAVGAKVAADGMMIEPARFIAGTVASTGVPSWEYRFSYVAESMRKEWPGAPHASEIPYVFDTVKARYGANLTAADEKVAQDTNAYWVNFARYGDPNGAGLPTWPQYSASHDVLLDFTAAGPNAIADPWKARLDLTAARAEGK